MQADVTRHVCALCGSPATRWWLDAQGDPVPRCDACSAALLVWRPCPHCGGTGRVPGELVQP